MAQVEGREVGKGGVRAGVVGKMGKGVEGGGGEG